MGATSKKIYDTNVGFYLRGFFPLFFIWTWIKFWIKISWNMKRRLCYSVVKNWIIGIWIIIGFRFGYEASAGRMIDSAKYNLMDEAI